MGTLFGKSNPASGVLNRIENTPYLSADLPIQAPLTKIAFASKPPGNKPYH